MSTSVWRSVKDGVLQLVAYALLLVVSLVVFVGSALAVGVWLSIVVGAMR